MSSELQDRRSKLETQVAALRTEVRTLIDIPDPTDAQLERLERQTAAFEARQAELDSVVRQIAEERSAKVDRIAAIAKNPGAVHPAVETFNVNRGSDPWDRHNRDDANTRARQSVAECRDASDEAKQAATELLERAATEEGKRYLDGVDEHILATGRPAYVAGFREYVRSPEYFGRSLTGEQADAMRAVRDMEQRSAMSLTAANGGYLVPHFLDPTIVLTNNGTANDVRQVSRVEKITTGVWEGVTSANSSAEWLAEAATAADATPTFQGPSVTTQKAAAWVFGSLEMLQDSGFDQISVLIGDAFDRLEETAFATGTGSGQPLGLVTALSGTGPAVTCTSAAGATECNIVAADAYALDNALGARFRRNARFMASKTVWNALRQVATANNSASFWVDYANGAPSSLIGYPVSQNAGMPTTFTSAASQCAVVLGDFSQYLIADRIGTSIAFVPVIMSTAVPRPTGQAGWFAHKRVGAGVLTSNAFKTLLL